MARMWFKIQSWHVVKSSFTSRGGAEYTKALCGQERSGVTITHEFDADEKTCESCLRILAKQEG